MCFAVFRRVKLIAAAVMISASVATAFIAPVKLVAANPVAPPSAEISDIDKARAKAFNTGGVKYFAEKKYLGALDSFQVAVRFNPLEPTYHANLGATYN